MDFVIEEILQEIMKEGVTMKEYALYKGEEILSIGTAKEIADELGVLVETVRFYGTPRYIRRLEKREAKNARILVCLEDD